MKKLIAATNNKGKLVEIRQLLSGKFDIISLCQAGIDVDVEETGSTFLENALIKAKAIFELTGQYSLSDDSGICVDALEGAPGVYSARFAGGHDDKKNNDLLLYKLKNVTNRAAHFECAVVLYMGENNYIYGIGKTKGKILHEPIGTNGFGYDPLFYSTELDMPFALASLQQKNTVSHRFKAINQLLSKL